ncbi:hypothetical protein MTO96_026978 [Rhipicephalus appendiculatus]
MRMTPTFFLQKVKRKHTSSCFGQLRKNVLCLSSQKGTVSNAPGNQNLGKRMSVTECSLAYAVLSITLFSRKAASVQTPICVGLTSLC